MKIRMVRERAKYNMEELYALRAQLVKAIDPLEAGGIDLHEVFMDIAHKVNLPPKSDQAIGLN